MLKENNHLLTFLPESLFKVLVLKTIPKNIDEIEINTLNNAPHISGVIKLENK